MEVRMERLRSSGPHASHSSTRRFGVSDHVDGMERLLHAVQELSLTRSLSDIQRVVRSAARELTGCDGATVVLSIRLRQAPHDIGHRRSRGQRPRAVTG
jgi:hypothetical protein